MEKTYNEPGTNLIRMRLKNKDKDNNKLQNYNLTISLPAVEDMLTMTPPSPPLSRPIDCIPITVPPNTPF